MDRKRHWLVALLSTMVALSLAAACSDRDNSKSTPAGPADGTSGERVAAAVDRPSEGTVANPPGRAVCRPAGVLGQANPSSPGPFMASFSAQTDRPLGVCGASEWDILIHSRGPDTWYSLDQMSAQHGPDCAGPPASHELHGDHSAAVFLCRDHLMTALNAEEYGVIYLVPNQLVDLSGGPVTIRFDLSTERMSSRDWIDLWLSPWEDNLALPLEASDPDLQGPPRNSIQVTTANGEGSPVLRTTREWQPREYQPGYAVSPLGDGVTPGTNESATRQAFQLTISPTNARLERLASATAPALLYWDEPIEFPFDLAVLQLGHHSYTPTKDNSGLPATWHWDNVGISNAVPFELNRAVERYADSEHDIVTFERPAAANANVRFAAIGAPELSFDAGRTWLPAERQDGLGQVQGEHHPEHFSSYWMPIPEGTAELRVRFEPDDWYSGPYFAQGFSIWSR